ncbi:MAG: hypothetical protein ACXVZO_01275 [Gaiellaceae bacterium]
MRDRRFILGLAILAALGIAAVVVGVVLVVGSTKTKPVTLAVAWNRGAGSSLPGAGTLFLIDPKTHHRTSISQSAANRVLTGSAPPVLAPVWSRDGSRLAFTSLAGGVFQVFLSSGSGHPGVLTHLLFNGFVVPVSWSPDGKQLIIRETSSGVQPSSNLLLVSTSSGAARRIMAKGLVGDAQWVGSTGKLLVLHVDNPTAVGTVQLVEPGGNVRALTPPGLTVGEAAVSPHGDLAALSAVPLPVTPSSTPEIWLIRLDTGESRRVIPGDQPAWSPDGSRIAFECKRVSVCIADSAGRVLRTVAIPLAGGPIRSLVWAPDSRRVAFSVRFSGTTQRVMVVGVDGDNLHVLPWDPALPVQSFPAWSPDGHLISFVEQGLNPSRELYAVATYASSDAKRGSLPRLTPIGQTAMTPAWRPR